MTDDAGISLGVNWEFLEQKYGSALNTIDHIVTFLKVELWMVVMHWAIHHDDDDAKQSQAHVQAQMQQ